LARVPECLLSFLICSLIVTSLLVAQLAPRDGASAALRREQAKEVRLRAALADFSPLLPAACRGLESESSAVSRLALSVGITENYFRPRLRRNAELLFARGYIFLTGRLPRFSLGVGQITPEVAVQTLKDAASGRSDRTLSSASVLQLLQAPQSNIALVAAHLKFLAATHHLAIESTHEVKVIAALYNAGVPSVSASREYSAFVFDVYSRLDSSFDCHRGPAPAFSPTAR
jgi:hypothetical protein